MSTQLSYHNAFSKINPFEPFGIFPILLYYKFIKNVIIFNISSTSFERENFYF